VRVIAVYSLKGGVGKTTVAAATAVRAAGSGNRTLIMSTDPAHSLGDSFDQEIGEHATPIAENLWAEQIDAQSRLESNWREIQDYFVQLMNWAGVETIQAEELSVIPGLDEIFALIDVKAHVEGGKYDLLIVDCAPTAETLRLLGAPTGQFIYPSAYVPVPGRRADVYSYTRTERTSAGATLDQVSRVLALVFDERGVVVETSLVTTSTARPLQ